MTVASKSLIAENLVAGYGAQPVLRGVSFNAEAGKILTVVGPNGSGKSTLMKTVLGLVRPTAGRIYLDGTDITSWSTAERAEAGLGYVPQEANVFPNMSVIDNLRVAYDFVRASRATPFEGVALLSRQTTLRVNKLRPPKQLGPEF
ncbi:ATP-binding cassette domain-containing protein [Rhizobium rhizogenes]|uniref:ATP-binding cassette domain-containing protein n=1 Tax=Rhizobium rhizogenes TaxID=359 RepID=UPI0015729C8D|nr:ATP-binding cassette domain-containing protein [Rhizobium rhizogenes]NTF98313.1 ATP-binding cassette domain-containing protein [Rhizobium rhizogenes]